MSSPANAATKPAASGWSRSVSAARRRPAAQPSVRAQRLRITSGSSSTPAAASSVADSSSVNARSASRSSRIAPSRRRRPTRSAGSIRVEITMRRPGDGWRSSRSRSAIAGESPSSCRSSSTSTSGSSSVSSALTSAGMTRPTSSAGCGASEAIGSGAPARRSASKTARQNRRRSASAGSSESQASGPVHVRCAAQALSSALLPAPAPAASRVSGPCSPSSSAVTRRGRSTHPAGARGGENFVAASASAS